MASGISVVICCFNSVLRIEQTLNHLMAQKGILQTSWEVIIVDNKSTDNTAEFSRSIWNSYDVEKPAFNVIFEPLQGLSMARSKGIEASQFDYVLFCDDDNWLNEDYLKKALENMETSPYIGALGGEGTPIFEMKEPPYFWINQYHVLAVGPQAEKEGDITDTRRVLYGAGMVINKNAYNTLIKKFQFQFLISDRKGNSLISSGDHELCFALRIIGYKIYYSRELKFRHFIPGSRTTIEYYKKLFLEFGKSYALLQPYHINKNKILTLKNDYRYICLRCIKNVIVLNLKLLIKGYYFERNKYKYVDYLHQLYYNIGIFKILLKVKNIYRVQLSILPIFSVNKH